MPNLSSCLFLFIYLFIAIFDHYKQHLVLLGLSSPFPLKWRPANRKCIPTSGQLCTFSSGSILTPLECKTRHILVSEKHFLYILSILCPRHLPPWQQLLAPVILFCSSLPGYMTLPSLLKSPSLYLSMAWGWMRQGPSVGAKAAWWVNQQRLQIAAKSNFSQSLISWLTFDLLFWPLVCCCLHKYTAPNALESNSKLSNSFFFMP